MRLYQDQPSEDLDFQEFKKQFQETMDHQDATSFAAVLESFLEPEQAMKAAVALLPTHRRMVRAQVMGQADLREYLIGKCDEYLRLVFNEAIDQLKGVVADHGPSISSSSYTIPFGIDAQEFN
jgi:hypothetical protein